MRDKKQIDDAWRLLQKVSKSKLGSPDHVWYSKRFISKCSAGDGCEGATTSLLRLIANKESSHFGTCSLSKMLLGSSSLHHGYECSPAFILDHGHPVIVTAT